MTWNDVPFLLGLVVLVTYLGFAHRTAMRQLAALGAHAKALNLVLSTMDHTRTRHEDWIHGMLKSHETLDMRVQELERLWAIAQENPELIRELALQALKGRDP